MSASGNLFLDTSAYLAVLLGRKESKNLLKILPKKKLYASTLLLIEAERNLIRLTREKDLTQTEFSLARERLQQDKESFILKDVAPDLALNGDFPAIRLPRSSDLVHLRTALWFSRREKIDFFCTFDKAQAAAAEEMGLPVFDKI